jgi:hypothetical protein
MVRDPKVVADMDLPAAQDPTVAGRLVHRWAHASKADVTPVALKVVAMTAAGSSARHRGAVTIAIVSPARAVVTSSATGSQVLPIIGASIEIVAHAVLKEEVLNATDMRVPHADTKCNANASPVRPSVTASMAPGLRARHVRRSIGV